MSKACLDIILNSEVIALNQDKMVSRARLVYQWPDASWPNETWVPPSSIWANSSAPAPPPAGWQQETPDIVIQIWVKPLHNGDMAVVAFNRGPNQVDVEISWPMIGLSDATSAAVRDLWLHKDLGSFTGSFKASVGSHDVFTARITPQV